MHECTDKIQSNIWLNASRYFFFSYLFKLKEKTNMFRICWLWYGGFSSTLIHRHPTYNQLILNSYKTCNWFDVLLVMNLFFFFICADISIRFNHRLKCILFLCFIFFFFRFVDETRLVCLGVPVCIYACF